MATYLPVLLGSVNAIPDDSVLSDLPRGQVDYLSHEWREEDVWRSWRNMTRLKNEIANGVRLENASWRTWWKQRNGLKTVTPETLNWLKDSDVTWLYGPLHTADQFVPTPKPSPSTAAALDLPSSPSPPRNGSVAITKKPILKHRSIGELLTSDFPLSPMFSPPDSDEDSGQIMSDQAPLNPATSPPKRPSLMHTKSDTHITRWGPNRAFRRDSPPRVGLNGEPSATEMRSSLLQSESPLPSTVPGPKRKHISFNTFVEQCIAIDKPKKKRTAWSNFPRGGHIHPPYGSGYGFEDDGYDEDSEDGIIDEADEVLFDEDEQPQSPGHPSYPQIPHPQSPSHPHHSPPHHSASPPSSSTSEDDDDDDVLEIRVRHPPPTPPPAIARSSSHSSSSSSTSSRSRPPKARSASYSAAGHPRRGSNAFIMRSPSTDKELVTIAFIAPTILKTKIDEDERYPRPLSHTHMQSHSYRAGDAQQGKEWYSYGAHDTPIELVYVPPSYVSSSMDESDGMVEDTQVTACDASMMDQTKLFEQPLVASPNSAPEALIVQQEWKVESVESVQLVGPGVVPRDDRMPRYAEGGASSVTVGRSPVGPEVVVSSEDGSPHPTSRSRSRSRSQSRSRTPSPNMATATPSSSAIPVPRTIAPAQATGSAFLSPAGPGPSRGRSASSPALSSQAQVEQPRGRSITRTSSFSDRESLNTGSPLGSLSPDGNLGLGMGSVRVKERERDTRGEREGRKSVERGRNRFARSSGSHSESGSNSSLSPEDPCASLRSAVSHRPQPEQSPASEVRKKSGSSSSGSSTVTSVSATTTRLPPRLVVDAKPTTQTAYTDAPSIPISPGCVQEEQESISRQPTPTNSPVLQMRSSLPKSTSPTRPPTVCHERKASYGNSRSPTRGAYGDEGQQGGTLVGRAVEIMSNAGAFLGSFWHSGTQPGVSTP